MALAGREERASQAQRPRFGNGEFADLLIVLGEAHLRRDPDEVCCLLQRAEDSSVSWQTLRSIVPSST